MLDGLRWILFDAVGTLIYPDPPVAEAYHAAAQRFGSRLSADEISRRFRAALAASQSTGIPTSEARERERWERIVSQVIDDVLEGQQPLFEQLWRHFGQMQHWRLYDDVADTFRQLSQRGFHLGIASNFDSRLKEIVAGHPILAACDAVFISSEVGFTKPHPQFFQTVEEQLGVAPAEIALVGDDEVADVQGATTAGWRAIRLDRSGDFLEADAIRSLHELTA